MGYNREQRRLEKKLRRHKKVVHIKKKQPKKINIKMVFSNIANFFKYSSDDPISKMLICWIIIFFLFGIIMLLSKSYGQTVVDLDNHIYELTEEHIIPEEIVQQAADAEITTAEQITSNVTNSISNLIKISLIISITITILALGCFVICELKEKIVQKYQAHIKNK